MKALYQYYKSGVYNSSLWIGRAGDPEAEAYEVGEVYLLDLDSIPDHYRSCFERVDEPPDCRSVPVAAFAETCDKLIVWMKGEIAQGLQWEVPSDYRIKMPEGEQVPVANRPVSASELLKPRINALRGGYILTTDVSPPSRQEVDALDNLDSAITLVNRLKGQHPS